ncbi:hypothetical protein DV737_g2402, partial [Chaetothyriales sp. CBS 132003]
MPGTESKHPRPACVEDWDEDAQTTVSSTRATANAAAKRTPAGRGARPAQSKYIRDGSDSGYSSKAGTIASTSTNKTNGTKPCNLTVDTSLHERQRQPYSMTLQPQSNASRNSHDRPSGAHHAQPSTKAERFKHPPKVCWLCDQLGYHPDNNELARLMQPPTPTSPKANKKSSKAEQEAQKKLRRQSSTRESRPCPVIYAPPITQNFYPVTSTYPPAVISTPITPQPQMPYVQEQLVCTYAPMTPIPPQYVVEPGQPNYLRPQPAKKDRPSQTNRLSNIYDQPVIHYSQPQEAKAASKASSKASSKESSRPSIKSRPSTRSADQQQAEREAMPPPGWPKQKIPGRSGSKDSTAYTTVDVDDRYLHAVDLAKPRAPPRESSPSREGRAPPSAYKHVEQASGTASRPPMRRKSVSYSDPISTTQVAVSSSAQASTSHQRRSTTSSDRSAGHDRMAADAEAYMQRNSRLTAEQLTAEKIAEMKTSKHVVSSRSETGSTFSQHSHQSSSKSSSGRDRSHTRGRRTSILIDGGIKLEIPQDYLDRKGRPLSMQLGSVNISVGNKDMSTSVDKRDHKLIEKAPSVASHRSKRSVTDSSHDVSKAKGKHRDDGERAMRQAPHASDAKPTDTGKPLQEQSADYSMHVYGA